MPIIFKVVAK